MTAVQQTFTRGNYTGHWSEDPETDLSRTIAARSNSPLGGSGSLQILFKGKEEIVLVQKAEHAAEKVFNVYCEPDWHDLAEKIWADYKSTGAPLSDSLKAVGDDDRHIEHDVYVVRKVLRDLAVSEGHDPQDFSELSEV